MKTIMFDPEKGRLKVNFRFEGLIAASYIFNYFEANSNDLVITPPPHGNNLNNDDDHYALPMPSILNKGRLIFLHVAVNAIDQDASYSVSIELYQGKDAQGNDNMISSFERPGFIKTGDATQNPMLIVKLDC